MSDWNFDEAFISDLTNAIDSTSFSSVGSEWVRNAPDFGEPAITRGAASSHIFNRASLLSSRWPIALPAPSANQRGDGPWLAMNTPPTCCPTNANSEYSPLVGGTITP